MKSILDLSFTQDSKGNYKKVKVKLGYYETYIISRTNFLTQKGSNPRHHISKETMFFRGANTIVRRAFYSYISDESFEKAIIKIQKMCDKNDKWLKSNSHDRTDSSPYTQITTESLSKEENSTLFLEQRIKRLEEKIGIKESSTDDNVGYVLSCLSDEGLSDDEQRDFYELASQRDKEQLASYAEKFNNAEDYNDSTGGRFQRQVIAPALSIVRRVVGYR